MPHEKDFPNEEEPFDDEPLDEDPEKNLRLENELLHLKIRAEFGGISQGTFNLSPEVENHFLKRIIELENNFKEAAFVRVLELIGHPEYKKWTELDEWSLIRELDRLKRLLAEKNLAVVFLRPREARSQYRFITEELLFFETENLVMPGMIKYFVYEEFHPDHELVLRERTKNILAGWFERNAEMMGIYLAKQFIPPNGQVVDRDELKKRLKQLFSNSIRFERGRFTISNISFVLKRRLPHVQAMGHSEGRLSYVAVGKNGERRFVEGPFKLYFACEAGWWSTFFFYLPGFRMAD